MAIGDVMNYSSVLRNIIVWSLLAFVYSKMMTLRLRDAAVVYGQPFALVCYTTVDATTQYANFFRSLSCNDDGIDVAYIRAGPGLCNSEVINYNYSCDNNGKNITLIVPADNLNEHNTFWRCINPGGTVLADNNIVSVFVNVPVSSVQLDPASRVTLRESDSRILTCTTSFCRPEAVISWWKNDLNITDMAKPYTHNQNTTTGTLVYMGNRLDNGQTIVCKAWNGYGSQQISQQIILDVKYAPAVPPTIGTFFNGSVLKVIENTTDTLTCIVTGGNPLAYLSWNCFGLAVSSNAVNQTVTSTITLTVNRTRDHQDCQCVSTQEIQGNRTAYVLIHVLYPPRLTPFTSPVKVIEGHPLELVCRAEGNPPPKLTWSPQGDDMVNQSRLYYHNISRSNNGTHTCMAINTMDPTTGSHVTRSDSKGLFVDVLYSATVIPFPLPIKVIEGGPLEVECNADGNPYPQLTWSPPGEDRVNQSRLYYHSISRNNHGIHTCTAINTMEPTTGSPVTWSDSKGLVIDILYRASIYAFTAKDNNNTIMEKDYLQIYCQVESNPYSDIFLYHEDKLQLKKEENALKLTYNKTAGCLDAGKYTCRANNSIMNGSSAYSDLQIMVRCHPRLDHRKNVSTVYYKGLNNNATLEVYVIAYPEPTNIIWYHRENYMGTWQRVTYQPPSLGGLFSSILIHLVSLRDFGYYMVTMNNNLGNFSHTYNIIPESVPEVPKNFSVTESGPDYVTLEWAPGFGGGHPQHFIIEYATHLDGDWLKSAENQDIGKPVQSFILPGLQQKTTYQFRMYAENKIGRSEKTQTISATTSDKVQADVFPVGAVAGSISGAMVIVVLVILVLIFLRRRGLRNKEQGDHFTRELQAKKRPESGLVDNPVYNSSDPLPGPSTGCGAVGDDYAVVIKKTRVDDASNLYAQVDKKNNKKGGEKGKRGKISRGDVYENSNLFGQSTSEDKLYKNSKAVKTEEASDDNVSENRGAASSIGHLVSKDGLLYADLMLDPPTTKNGKPFIRGLENRTEYSKIAYGKRGEPLLDSDNEQEKKNKSGATEEANK